MSEVSRIAEPKRSRPRTINRRDIGRRRYTLRIPMDIVHDRPRTRAECREVPRPCPYVGCRWNLYLDVTKNGGIKLNFPDIEPGDMEHSCALDVADGGGMTMPEIAELMNISRERVRQIEAAAFHMFVQTADDMDVDLRRLLDLGGES